MNRKSEFKKVKELIKENIEYGRCGLFNTRNITGDYLETLFDGQYFTLDFCYNYGYFEVFGMNDEEYQTLLIYYERYLAKYYKEKEDEEIERLNNIINRAIDFILTNILDDEEYPGCMYLEKEDNEKLLAILRGYKE